MAWGTESVRRTGVRPGVAGVRPRVAGVRPRVAGRSADSGQLSRKALSSTVFGAALAGALVTYRSLWADPAGSTLGSIGHTNGPMQMMWFLKWTPWQLLHGHSPFTTDALFYPEGVSLAWNTLAPTLGILAAPVTLTLGAPVGFAVLMTLAPALTALTGSGGCADTCSTRQRRWWVGCCWGSTLSWAGICSDT